MYPRNPHNVLSADNQKRDGQRRQQNSAPPSRIFCAVPTPKQQIRNEASTIHSFQYPQVFPTEHPSSPSWYYIGPKGTSINNYYENGLIRVAAPPSPYVYPMNSNFIPNNGASSSYVYPQQLWRPAPPLGDPSRSMYYFHQQQPDTTLSAKNYFHPSLEAKGEGNTSNNKEKKIACNPAACNCLVISLSASIVTLLFCFGLLVTYIVTQPTFLQLNYPSQPQQQVQASDNNKSQQMQKQQFSPSGSPVGNTNKNLEQTLDDFSLAFADKTTTLTPVASPVVAPYKDVPQSSQGKNDYYDFIEAFQGSASSILASKPTLALLTVDPFKTTAAPIKDTSGSKSTTNNSKVTTEVEFSSSNTAFFGKSNSTSVKNSSQEDTKIAAPAKSKEKSHPTSAPATSLTSSTSGVKKTPAPTTTDGYYYYYYSTEKPVKNKGKSTNSTTSEKTKNNTEVKTADSRTSDVALDAVLSSLLSTTTHDNSDSASTSTTSSSSQSYSQASNKRTSEATPTPSPYSTSTSSSSSSQSESQSSKIISYDEPTPSPSPFSSGAGSGIQRDSQPSNLSAFSSDPNTLSANGQQLPGTLLGAINDDDANVSVYGNAKSTIPCDLLMCDDTADDDYSDTKDSTSNSESGGVTYDFSGNGILPGPYDTVTMTSESSTSPDGKMTSNPIEQIVGTPITQNSNNLDNNNTDDGLCLDC
jgi:hypothetical protein